MTADNNRGWTMTAAVDHKGTQDWVANYYGEGMMVASDAGDSRVVMMAAMVEDSSGRQQWPRWMTTVADGNGGR